MSAAWSVATPRLALRPWQRADLDAYRAWPPFADPLLRDFRYTQRTAAEADLYWSYLAQNPQHRQWSIWRAQEIVGTLSLSRIDQRAASGWLGMLVAAPFARQGLGHEALTGWLAAYFGPWGFRELRLEVADWNGRARQLYDRLGFTAVRRYSRFVGPASAWQFLDSPAYQAVRQHFRWGNEGVYATLTEMQLRG